MDQKLAIAVLVSGRGSNLSALLNAIEGGACQAEVRGVVSDRPEAPALELARARNLPVHVVSPKDYPDRDAWDAALAACVEALAPELVVLAGFMRLLGRAMLEQFEGRIINVHPSLLPAFPGVDAPAQAIRTRVAISGCTVHVVDAGVDSGPILAQAAVAVLPQDDAASLHARIQRAEHVLLPQVVDAIARGRYTLGPTPRFMTSDALSAPDAWIWPKLSD